MPPLPCRSCCLTFISNIIKKSLSKISQDTEASLPDDLLEELVICWQFFLSFPFVLLIIVVSLAFEILVGVLELAAHEDGIILDVIELAFHHLLCYLEVLGGLGRRARVRQDVVDGKEKTALLL